MSELTPRERQVEALILEGLTNKQIGASLRISPRTVEVHRARVLDKRGKTNAIGIAAERTAALVRAVEEALALDLARWIGTERVERLIAAVNQAKGA